MKRASGFTFLEVMIALAVIAIAFSVLASGQVSNLRATAQSRDGSAVKALATQALDRLTRTLISSYPNPNYDPNTAGSRPYYFQFTNYYYGCPASATPPASVTQPIQTVTCSGTDAAASPAPYTTTYAVAYLPGVIDGEGLISVTVRSSKPNAPSVSLVNYISCYDVYPSPTKDAPEPCQVPTQAGGGRP